MTDAVKLQRNAMKNIQISKETHFNILTLSYTRAHLDMLHVDDIKDVVLTLS